MRNANNVVANNIIEFLCGKLALNQCNDYQEVLDILRGTPNTDMDVEQVDSAFVTRKAV